MILIGQQADMLCEVLRHHYGHCIGIALYGDNVSKDDPDSIWDGAIECLDCGEVIIDGDRSIQEDEGSQCPTCGGKGCADCQSEDDWRKDE